MLWNNDSRNKLRLYRGDIDRLVGTVPQASEGGSRSRKSSQTIDSDAKMGCTPNGMVPTSDMGFR